VKKNMAKSREDLEKEVKDHIKEIKEQYDALLKDLSEVPDSMLESNIIPTLSQHLQDITDPTL
jgi:hypothetical protein